MLFKVKLGVWNTMKNSPICAVKFLNSCLCLSKSVIFFRVFPRYFKSTT